MSEGTDEPDGRLEAILLGSSLGDDDTVGEVVLGELVVGVSDG